MTIKEAVNTWMPVVAMGVEGMPEIKEAVRMAIVSLEEWEKVRQEMEDYKYIPVRDLLFTLYKHLQEVEDSTCDDCKTPCVMYEKGMRGCSPTGAEVLDKIRAEIIDTLYVDSLIFGELIDFRNGKISADDVIEEFNRVTRLEVLQIIDKYKAESEGEE